MAIEKLPGLNIQAPWARLLLEGKKTIETRTYPLPEKYREKDLWLIETPGRIGTFKARVIGVIRFSECKQYSSESEFARDFERHLIPNADAEYAWKDGSAKYGWIIESVRPVRPFQAPYPRGIIYCGAFTATRGMDL